MIKNGLLKHRFATNLDYKASSIVDGNRVSMVIPYWMSQQVEGTIDLESEITLSLSDSDGEIEDTMEADLLEISENMSETMGFSHITFPIIENIIEPDSVVDIQHQGAPLFDSTNSFSNSIFTLGVVASTTYSYHKTRLTKGRVIRHSLIEKKGVPHYIKRDNRVTYSRNGDNLVSSLFGFNHGQI